MKSIFFIIALFFTCFSSYAAPMPGVGYDWVYILIFMMGVAAIIGFSAVCFLTTVFAKVCFWTCFYILRFMWQAVNGFVSHNNSGSYHQKSGITISTKLKQTKNERHITISKDTNPIKIKHLLYILIFVQIIAVYFWLTLLFYIMKWFNFSQFYIIFLNIAFLIVFILSFIHDLIILKNTKKTVNFVGRFKDYQVDKNTPHIKYKNKI